MARQTTLRLPESLFEHYESQAKQEGVSLNQLLVYVLSRNAGFWEGARHAERFVHLMKELDAIPDAEAEAGLQRLLDART